MISELSTRLLESLYGSKFGSPKVKVSASPPEFHWYKLSLYSKASFWFLEPKAIRTVQILELPKLIFPKCPFTLFQFWSTLNIERTLKHHNQIHTNWRDFTLSYSFNVFFIVHVDFTYLHRSSPSFQKNLGWSAGDLVSIRPSASVSRWIWSNFMNLHI